MSNAETFDQQKYTTVSNLVPVDLCRIVTKYALMKEEMEFTPEGPGTQVDNAHSVYGDTLTETLLYFLKPHIENATGKQLSPTYSYYRVYRPGDVLKKHIDRPACEISTTICFGYYYTLKDEDYRWGLCVDQGTLIKQNVGDGIIYRGCEIEHWRDEFDAGQNSYQVQAFFHYIDKNGPFYPEWTYDTRPGLGFRMDQKKVNQIDR
jgi:hypothetical protein